MRFLLFPTHCPTNLTEVAPASPDTTITPADRSEYSSCEGSSSSSPGTLTLEVNNRSSQVSSPLLPLPNPARSGTMPTCLPSLFFFFFNILSLDQHCPTELYVIMRLFPIWTKVAIHHMWLWTLEMWLVWLRNWLHILYSCN